MKQSAALAAAFAVALGWSQASTASQEVCAAELDAVRASIESGVFSGKNAASDQSNLLAKVDAAESKLAEGKPADASLKLQELADTATALAAAPKPKLQDASGITASVDTAIACVAGL